MGTYDKQCTNSTTNRVTVVPTGPPKNSQVVYIQRRNLSQLLHRDMAMPITRRDEPPSSTPVFRLQAVAILSVRSTAVLLVSIVSCICRPKGRAAHEYVEALVAASAHFPRASPVPFWQLTTSRTVLPVVQKLRPVVPHNNPPLHMSNEGTGFFPGHASLAYFFFLGSGGRLASATAGCTVTTGAAAGFSRGAPAGSISGAGFGR